MVSQSPSDVVAPVRGFVTEETVITTSSGVNNLSEYPAPSFWGSIVAGTVVTMGIGALSECLMIGCHVGAYQNGAIYLSGGVAVWMIITTCIAYFFGGLVAGQLSLRAGWMRGVTLWGFSIVLTVLMAAAVALGTGVAYAHSTNMTEGTGSGSLYNGTVFLNNGGAWAAFLFLAAGLIFSAIGSSVGCGCSSETDRQIGA